MITKITLKLKITSGITYVSMLKRIGLKGLEEMGKIIPPSQSALVSGYFLREVLVLYNSIIQKQFLIYSIHYILLFCGCVPLLLSKSCRNSKINSCTDTPGTLVIKGAPVAVLISYLLLSH